MKEGAALPEGWEELTPPHMLCGIGMCPAVLRDTAGNYLIIGKVANVPQLAARVGPDEVLISIPTELLDDIVR